MALDLSQLSVVSVVEEDSNPTEKRARLLGGWALFWNFCDLRGQRITSVFSGVFQRLNSQGLSFGIASGKSLRLRVTMVR
jgi:hypothetical protein